MRKIELKWIALLAGLLPLLASYISYAISVYTGQAELCNVFLEGCISVSRAARKLPALMIFRAIMIPGAVMMIAFWYLALRWLRQTNDIGRVGPPAMSTIGMIGGVFLIMYATYLGTDGDVYRLLRRYGITIFFAFTYLAQLMLARRIQILKQARKLKIPTTLYRLLVIMGVVLLLLGLASIPIQHAFDLSTVDNAIEWSFGTLMCGYFVLYFFAWDVTKFKAQTSVNANQ